MTAARLGLAAFVTALATATLPAASGAGSECNGVPQCISVPGPWVIVPAHRQATYLLECPGRRGVVGGLDAALTTQDVRVTFEGLVASPVAAGRTTTRYAFFQAVSAKGVRGAFQPRIGCIPQNQSRNTTSASVVPLGAPLDLAATTVLVRAGTVQRATFGCVAGEHLVTSWDATMFATKDPPPLELANLVHVKRSTRAGQVSVSITGGASLPAGAKAQVQVGVECAGR